MDFNFETITLPAQQVALIRLQLTVPAFHEATMPTLKRLFAAIEAGGATDAGDPIVLYYGPVNEEEDGPVDICVPYSGTLSAQGDIMLRELPAHTALSVKTFGEYNRYPDVLTMWNALARTVDERGLTPDWRNDMTTYEIWHDDMSMTIGWPIVADRPGA